MEYQSVKLIPIELRKMNFPEAHFLTADEQERYEDSIKQYTGKAYGSLNIPQRDSNLFKVLYLNQIGIRTVTMPELESAHENGLLLSWFYEDTPTVLLRSVGDTYELNDYLAKSLAKQLNKRNIEHILVINGLTIKSDSNSPYGLSLVPGEKGEYFEVPELDHGNEIKRFSRFDERGIPIFDEEGGRILYTRANGLSRWYLYHGRSAGADYSNLAGSGAKVG